MVKQETIKGIWKCYFKNQPYPKKPIFVLGLDTKNFRKYLIQSFNEKTKHLTKEEYGFEFEHKDLFSVDASTKEYEDCYLIRFRIQQHPNIEYFKNVMLHELIHIYEHETNTVYNKPSTEDFEPEYIIEKINMGIQLEIGCYLPFVFR